MKKYLVLILGIALFACTKQPESFIINVNLEGAEGQMLLEQRGATAWIPVDTADIVEGIAVLEGKVEQPGDYYLSVLGQRAKSLIFVENAEMYVVGKVDSLNMAKVTGSATHDEYQAVNEKMTIKSKEYMKLYQESRKVLASGDTVKAEKMMDEVYEMVDQAKAIQVDFVKDNPSSYVTPVFLSQVQQGMDVEELDALVKALDPKFDSMQSIIDLKERITQLKTVAIGQIAPDFTQNDPDGNPIKFSDIYSKNEVTLLDFWAAWCGPCRGENPNVVAVYNDYKNKGFTVFGVSLDREKDAWLKAIDDDGLAWTQVSDLAYWQNAAAKTYAIRSIPSSLLVDKTGKIIAKDKRGNELRETVADILD